MSHVTYKIVEHDGGWAYTVDGVFSEPFATHAAALAAASGDTKTFEELVAQARTNLK